MTDAHTDNRRLRAEAMRLREKVDRLEAEVERLRQYEERFANQMDAATELLAENEHLRQQLRGAA